MNTEITAAQKTALLKLPGFKDIQKQYAKEAKMEGGRRKRMRGRGFWDDVGAWFVQAGKDVNQFLKDTKIVSNIAAYALPILGAMGGALLTVNPLGATAGGIAGKSAADYIKSQGYGSKMRSGFETPSKMRGCGTQHMMPDGTMMKGKMRGKGVVQDALNIFAPLAGAAYSQITDVQKKLPKMRGGELSNKLVLNPPGQRLMGKGKTFGMNGRIQESVAPAHSGIMRTLKGGHAGQDYRLKTGNVDGNKIHMIGGGGIPYGSISSEFGNVKF